LSSCDKGSDLIIEETAFPEIAEVYLLSDLGPNFVFPENLQYMDSNGVNSSVCIDISENFILSMGLDSHQCKVLQLGTRLLPLIDP